MRAKEVLSNIKAVLKRELSGYFGSPVAYVFIVIFLLLVGFFTFNVSKFYEIGQADLRGFFQWHPWVYMFLIPAVAMRLWSEERRLGTIELILTMPITPAEVIVGKFLAAWIFIAVALGLTFPMVLTVLYLGQPDLGTIFCGYVGSLLMAGAFLGIGSMTSSMTRSQVISFILAVVLCLFFILSGYAPVTGALSGWAPSWVVDMVAQLGVLTHFTAISRGIIDLRDILYFFSLILFMLFVNGIVILNRRTA